ncbi:hypothetical protein [Streptomyces sp. URMC 129]|uniref:hypothetical protein n=1 Tax=Streptomyces sp. URMC 129 TaxID=3423407 RepID=UPI003F1BF9C1
MTAAPRVWPPALDWSDSSHWNPAGLDDCVLCEGLTPLLSERGEPCHKTCAEDWYAEHPDAWELFERRRDQAKKQRTADRRESAGTRRTTPDRVHAETLPNAA